MRIYIIYTDAGPFKAYSAEEEAVTEYNRLQKLDDLVSYSIMNLPMEPTDK